MGGLIGWSGPNREAVPEDDSAPDTKNIFSRSGETFLVPGSYLNTIATNDDSVLAREGNQDLKLYDNLLDDDVAFSCFQQRRLAVVSHEWEVIPGDDEDPRSVEAADHLRLQLKQISWDRICNNMLFSVWFGYAVAEFAWKIGPDGKIWIDDILVPDRRWFGFTESGELRFSPASGFAGGLEVPANKFWVARTGASHDFAFYGLGLGHWCYWPIWFKRNVLKFWAVYLEKLGFPTVLGGFDTNWNDTEKNDFMKALIGIGRDRAARVPMDVFDKIKVVESSRSGGGTSSYLEFVTEQNEALMRIIVGQTSTTKATPQGIGGKGAEVHADVKAEIIKADADLLSESFPAAKWLTRWNFGEDVAPPRVYRVLDEGEDIDAIAERDVKLDSIGIKRTEESIGEIYGPGYEKVEPPVPVVMPALGAPPAANNDKIDFAALVDNIDFDAAEGDAIDRISRVLAEETNPILLEFASQLKDSLVGITSAEGMRIALLEAFEKMPAERLAAASGLPLLAERMAAASGLEEGVDIG